ncbi:MAG: ABC transporter permease [Bacteroidota bacterium]
MSSRWKKIWADFWGNKARTILTIMTIAVGAFAVGFNSNLSLYLTESMDGDFLSAEPSEAQIYAYPLDDDLLKMALGVPGVKAVEGRSTLYAKTAPTNGKSVSVQFFSLEDPNKLTVNLLKPVTGQSKLPQLGQREMIVDASAASLGYKPGDMVAVELNNGRVREMKLAGYVHDVTGTPFTLSQTINAYVTPRTMEWLGGPTYYDTLLVSVTEKQTDQVHVTEVAQAVADRLKRAGEEVYFVSVYQPGHHFAYAITKGAFFVLGVLSYLTVFLSAFLIINTITALITQQTRQIGMMKAIGGDSLQLLVMYLTLVLFFGLCALLIAVPLANLAAEKVAGSIASYFNFYPGPYPGYRSTLLQQAAVALAIPVLAAILPIYASVRMTVRDAISDYGIRSKATTKDRSIGRFVLWLSRPVRLSIRNVFRRRVRLTLTLFTLVLAGAIFISVYNLWATLDKNIESSQGYFLADINVGFNRYYRYEEVGPIAQSVPGVASAEGWAFYIGTLEMDKEEIGTQVQLIAPPSNSTLINPTINTGRWLMPGDENAIVIGNHLLKIYPDIKVGDWLTISIEDKETRWQVVGTYTFSGNLGTPWLYVNYEYISRLMGKPDQVYSLRILTNQHDNTSQRNISRQLVAAYKSYGIQTGKPELSTDWYQSQKTNTDLLVYFLLVTAVLIAVVGGLGLMGTMSINVLERTREIGVMRAIGASNGDIQGIVIIEGMLIGSISWGLSILLSVPITYVLCYGVGVAVLSAPMQPAYGVTGIVAWLLFSLFLAAISIALPARRASQLTVKDTLVYE